VTATKAETRLWLERTTNRGLDMDQRRIWPEGDARGSTTKQHRITVAKRKRSSPSLPSPGDLRRGVDAGQHRSQPSFSNQRVERGTQLRMITPDHQTAASPQQQIHLSPCPHAERMRIE
jgi:hypothetical protein